MPPHRNTRDRSGRHPGRLGPALVLAILLVPLLVLLGAQKDPGQKKAGSAAPSGKAMPGWTAEAHDGTAFPLVGRHRTLDCRECHVNLVFEGTPTDCEVCHWQRRQDDRYQLRLGARCADCHTPQSWKKVDPALWSHEAETGFRLGGVHRALDCEACHGAGGFEPRPTDCVACHEADYLEAREPDHVQAGFPTNCPGCHDERAWSRASFSHGSFTLQGRHASLDCSACHGNGVYAGTPTDCASCHLDDYDRASDPDHRAAGFPTTCDACHLPSHSSWGQAAFAHEFPITSGRHAGLSCTDCHTTSSYQQFDCLDCHAHERSAMDAEHQGRAGYSYSSLACLTCHPHGNA